MKYAGFRLSGISCDILEQCRDQLLKKLVKEERKIPEGHSSS